MSRPLIVSLVRAGDTLVAGEVTGTVTSVTEKEIVAEIDGHEARWGRHAVAPTFSTLPVPKALRGLVSGPLRLMR
jgi:hypothetical protein